MKKVYILQNKILHYRKPLYNKLSETVDLTIIHSGTATVNEQDLYKEIVIPAKKKGPFIFQKDLITTLKKANPDVIIGMLDIHWISILRAFFKFKTKFIWWGIGVSNNNFGNKIRAQFLKNKTPMIFYNIKGLEAFKEMGLDATNFFHCNNTFHIENRIKCFESEQKDNILFVGSLNERKQNDILIKAFNTITPKINNQIKIDIVGAGSEKTYLEGIVKELGLTNRVFFHGEINDTNILASYYEKAICSVSFGQAGLAVLQSLGYGVPFITKSNAISGGEKSNIVHGENGYFCDDSQESLSGYLLNICNNLTLSRQLGKNAYDFYTKNCTIDNMASTFKNAIESI